MPLPSDGFHSTRRYDAQGCQASQVFEFYNSHISLPSVSLLAQWSLKSAGIGQQLFAFEQKAIRSDKTGGFHCESRPLLFAD